MLQSLTVAQANFFLWRDIADDLRGNLLFARDDEYLRLMMMVIGFNEANST